MARIKNIWLVFNIAISVRPFLLLKIFFSETFKTVARFKTEEIEGLFIVQQFFLAEWWIVVLAKENRKKMAGKMPWRKSSKRRNSNTSI